MSKNDDSGKKSNKYLAGLSLIALGIVFGDIGTSPLYAFQESFKLANNINPTPANILGILSLIFWALILVVSVMYMIFIISADNDGEGGGIALAALISPRGNNKNKLRGWLVIFALFGTSLLYGDSMITPAISVVSAVGGLSVASIHLSQTIVVIITSIILLGLFYFQKHGSGGLGKIFGPIMIIWFVTIAAMGVYQIIGAPSIFRAVNPYYAIIFIGRHGFAGFFVLGSVFLVLTGVEALFADIGHFGAWPIRYAWFSIVLPGLLLNYFGQGALLLKHPQAIENPFFLMTSSWMLYLVVAIATIATIIASQAVISGAFSLTRQAIQMGFLPRMKIEQTSTQEVGQVYVPAINWMMMLICIALVYGFGSSTNLAGAYGVAVSFSMVITGVLFGFVTQIRWNWKLYQTLGLMVIFLIIDLSFSAANAVKFLDGGWFPLVVAAIILTLMTTWKRGREVLAKRLKSGELPFENFMNNVGKHAGVDESEIKRVEGTAIYMYSNASATPPALLHNLKHNKVLHKNVVILSVQNTDEQPYVPPDERIHLEDLKKGFYRIIIKNGFAQSVNVPYLLKNADYSDLNLNLQEVTYFLGKERILPTESKSSEMAKWRDRLFGLMVRNEQPATAFFHLPPSRVVEIGAQLEL